MTNRPLSLVVSLCAFSAFAAEGSMPARGSDADRASKNGLLTAGIGGAKVTVSYGRPKVKGRKVWGELVKGNEVWRAGADEATVVSFDTAVTVEGQKLAAGTYAFFVKPGKDPSKDQWVVMFNKEPKQWGGYKYDAKQDALTVKVTPKASEMTEELTYEAQADALVLKWEKLAVPVQIKKAG